jgi:hypothetical protein
MIRELELISRQFKTPRDVSLVRKDINLYEKELKREAAPFLQEVEKIAKREKLGSVILIALLYDPTQI